MYVVRIWEGLGNQMFQYAMGRALKYRTGQKVFLDTRRAYKESFAVEKNHIDRPYRLDKFNITLNEISVESIPAYHFLGQKTLIDKGMYWLSKKGKWFINFLQDADAEYHKDFFAAKGNYYVFGWFQQEAYFKDIRHILLKEFTPRNKICLPGELKSVLDNGNTVAIHVRRNDYLKCGKACNEYYYEKAIKRMNAMVKDPLYLVFSDDIEWAKKHIQTGYKTLYISREYNFEDYEELLIMSRCRHQIIANSTFSWWAAWLNCNADKNVIAPTNWFRFQSNIVPTNWMVLN